MEPYNNLRENKMMTSLPVPVNFRCSSTQLKTNIHPQQGVSELQQKGVPCADTNTPITQSEFQFVNSNLSFNSESLCQRADQSYRGQLIHPLIDY